MEREVQTHQRVQRPSRVYQKSSAAVASLSRGTRPGDIALIVVFLCGITLPLIGLSFDLDRGFKIQENRLLNTRPAWSWDRAALADFPGKFEAYFNDQFGFRKRLIHTLCVAKVLWLGVSSTPNVTLGKDGWLFFTGHGAYDNYRRTVPFTQSELEQWSQVFQKRYDWLSARGIRYLVVIPPNKETVYPEQMPAAINRVRKQSRLDQLHAYMRAHSTVPIVELTEPMRQAKSEGPLYLRTDTHWNTRGAYVAYEQIMGALSPWFPSLEPKPRSAFKAVACHQSGDLARMLGLEGKLTEATGATELAPISPLKAKRTSVGVQSTFAGDPKSPFATEIDEPKLPRAVMICDSFAEALAPYLSEHFRRIDYLRQYTLNCQLVEQQHPDVVIQELVERSLMAGIGAPTFFSPFDPAP